MSIAIEALKQQRKALIVEKQKAIEKFDQEILELESAILHLSGKPAEEIANETTYDDESPDYIKSSQEEI